MIRRPLGTELRRGPAPVVLIGLGAVGLLLLLDGATWAGQYQELALALRWELALVIPFAVGAATWQGGREARRGLTELLGSTARPGWQPLLLGWLAVTATALAAYGGTAVAGVALVRPVATYAGGSWPALILVGTLALGSFTAVGTLLGRLVPSRLTPPLAVIGSYLVLGWAAAVPGGGRLTPIINTSMGSAFALPGRVHLAQAIWFGGLAVAALLVAAARRPATRLGGASVAAVAALPILLLPGDELGNFPPWEPDPDAHRPVCAEGMPQVCVMQAHAFLLDDTVALLRPTLARLSEAAGVPVSARDSLGWEGLEPGDVHVQLSGPVTGGSPANPRLRPEYLFPGLVGCPAGEADGDAAQAAAVAQRSADQAVLAWAGGAAVDGRFDPGGTAAGRLEQLRALPDHEQLRRVGDYLRAVRECAADPAARL